MKVFIIEDEHLGLERLSRLALETDASLEITGHADSIASTVQWLKQHPAPDLIFMDIELADGQCFEIFNQVEVTSPIIFTTSYDEYALHAFQVNSVDYLLKPVRKEDLERSLAKLRRLQSAGQIAPNLEKLLREMAQIRQAPEFRRRFLVKQGQRLLAVETSEIAYCVADGKICWLKTWDNRRYLLDYTLEQLTDMLDPAEFFRVNRAYLAHVRSIKAIQPYFNGKLFLKLEPATEENDVIVSKEKAGVFKEWMGK